MEFITLETDRLILRKLDQEVYDFIFTNYLDEDLKSFLNFSSGEELEEAREKHQKGMSTYNRSFAFFQIIKKKSDKILGWCGFHTWVPFHHRAELGYELYRQNDRAAGIMSEALPLILSYGFNQLDLNRVEALIGAKNYPSLKLLINAGFTREGVLQQHYLHKGKLEDSIMYALLREDYIKHNN